MKTIILALALPLAGNIFALASDLSTVKWLTPTTHKTPKHLSTEAACNKKLYCGDKGAICGYDLCGCAACCPNNALCTGCIKSMIYNPGVINSCPMITPNTKHNDEIKIPVTSTEGLLTSTTDFDVPNAALITEAPPVPNDNVEVICGGGCGTLLCTVDKCGCPACCSKGMVCTGCLNDIVINPAGDACPGYTVTVDNGRRAIDIVQVTKTALLTLTSTIAKAAAMSPTATITNDSYIGTPFASSATNTTTAVSSTSTTYPSVGHPPPSGIVPDTSTTTSTTDDYTSTTTSTATSSSSSNQADHAGGSNPVAYIESLLPNSHTAHGVNPATNVKSQLNSPHHACSRSMDDCMCAYFELGSAQEKACHDYLHSVSPNGEGGDPVDVKVVQENVRAESSSNGEGSNTIHMTVSGTHDSKRFWKEKAAAQGEVEVGNAFLLKGKGVTTKTMTGKEKSVVTVTMTESGIMGHGEL